MKMSKWGMIEAWLAHDPRSRVVVIGIGAHGLQVTVVDPTHGQQVEVIGPNEEPADAAFRAISKFG